MNFFLLDSKPFCTIQLAIPVLVTWNISFLGRSVLTSFVLRTFCDQCPLKDDLKDWKKGFGKKSLKNATLVRFRTFWAAMQIIARWHTMPVKYQKFLTWKKLLPITKSFLWKTTMTFMHFLAKSMMQQI